MKSTESHARELLDRLETAAKLEDLEDCLEDVRARCQEWNVLSESADLAKILQCYAANLDKLAEFETGVLDRSKETDLMQRLINAIGGTALLLSATLRFHQSMSRVLIELWNALGEYQARFDAVESSPRHVYKAGLAMYLALIYLDQKEPGAAIWWLLLTQADDLLYEHGEKGGAGKDMLRLHFGVGDDILEKMEEIAQNCLSSHESHQLYAEYVVMKLAVIPDHVWLFSYPTTMSTYPVCRPYAQAMLSQLTGETTGTVLEELARYLILTLSGWVPSVNLYAIGTQIDSDIMARYAREPERVSEAHGRAMLVECKNYEKPVSVSQLGYFLYRMHLSQVDVGILFAKSGISSGTGGKSGKEAKYARRLLEQAFQRDGKAVIVIDCRVLNDLANSHVTLWSFISAELIKLRFGSQTSSES